MKKEELKKICDAYKEAIVEEDADRYLMILAENIERETRQQCASMAYDLANSIANMHRG